MGTACRPAMRLSVLMIAVISTTAWAADVTPPPAPASVTVANHGCKTLDISWPSSTDFWGTGVETSGLAYYYSYRRPQNSTQIIYHAAVNGDDGPHIGNQRHEVRYIDDTVFQIGISATDRAGNTSAIT